MMIDVKRPGALKLPAFFTFPLFQRGTEWDFQFTLPWEETRSGWTNEWMEFLGRFVLPVPPPPRGYLNILSRTLCFCLIAPSCACLMRGRVGLC